MYAIGKLLIDVIVALFVIGMAGSAVVIVISFVEDFRELFGPDESSPETEALPGPVHAKSAAYSYSMKTESPRHL
jgi:hypothetical protein